MFLFLSGPEEEWEHVTVAGCNDLWKGGKTMQQKKIREIFTRIKGDIAFPLVAVLRFAILHLATLLRVCNSLWIGSYKSRTYPTHFAMSNTGRTTRITFYFSFGLKFAS